jgi:hypothetical protein
MAIDITLVGLKVREAQFAYTVVETFADLMADLSIAGPSKPKSWKKSLQEFRTFGVLHH